MSVLQLDLPEELARRLKAKASARRITPEAAAVAMLQTALDAEAQPQPVAGAVLRDILSHPFRPLPAGETTTDWLREDRGR